MSYADNRVRLAEAMGWTDLREVTGTFHGTTYRTWVGLSSDGLKEVPDPRVEQDDANALEACLLAKGLEVETRSTWEHCSVSLWDGSVRLALAYCYLKEDSCPSARRRRALVDAACQALVETEDKP